MLGCKMQPEKENNPPVDEDEGNVSGYPPAAGGEIIAMKSF